MFKNKKLRGALAGLALGLTIASPAYAKNVPAGVTYGNDMYDISNATYRVYTDSEAKLRADDLSKAGTADAELIIQYTAGEATGVSNVVELKPGDYYIKEYKPPKGFKLDEEVHGPITIKASNTAESPKVFKVSDPPVTIDLSMLKRDADSKHPKGALGDATLEGATYEIRYYDELGINKSNYQSKDPERIWQIKTDANGEWKSGTDAWGGRDANKLYKLSDKSIVGLLGSYVITETVPPKGYLLDSEPQFFEASRSDKAPYDVTLSGPVAESTTDDTLAGIQGNDIIRGGVAVKKSDAETQNLPQGDGVLNATFRIFNISNESENAYQNYVENTVGLPVVPPIDPNTSMDELRSGNVQYVMDITATLTNGNSWIAQTAADALVYGTYRIIEIDAGTGYHLNESWSQDFKIRNNGEIVSYDVTNKVLQCFDPISRLGLKFEKVDTDALGPEATAEKYEALRKGQGNAALAGAEFAVTVAADTKNPVIVDGKTYQPGDVVATLVTKWDAATNSVIAATKSDTSLPYAKYTVTETKAPKGYLPITNPVANISLDDFVLDANHKPVLYVDGMWLPITNVTMVKSPINN